MKLTATQCKNAKPKSRSYKLSDGDGLYLEVLPSGRRYWRFQYHFNGKRPRVSFGRFPEVDLALARDKRAESRKLLLDGVDPGQKRKREKLRGGLASKNTYEVIAREWYELNKSRWAPRHARQILLQMEKDVFPAMGAFPITAIQASDILATVKLIEARGAHFRCRRALQYIGRIFRYAMVTGRANGDPTAGLSEALRPLKHGHLAALTIDEIPEFVSALRSNKARLYPQTILATELLMLTFVRTGELIKATWDEFDLEAARWLIPATRMKMKREHLVPLSRQTIAVLHQLQEISAGRDYILPSLTRPDAHISNNTVLMALDRMGYRGRMTGHGFRALAMSTIKEKLGYRHEVIDRQLAHLPQSTVDRAYDRAQFYDERCEMMQAWADYLDECFKRQGIPLRAT